ncbi:putative MFS-type transporter [Coleophoma crateriformis]|uniref:Putative MFS-type transporter n=1 Tax=Coleophoma crateriformis TaxID=565419 RepID=A0A3D8RCB3_9HELO|nr:putative MFS-type transporter [Coleophoma crateriformis]
MGLHHGEIDDEAIPGTVHLVEVDLSHALHTKHDAGQKDIVLVPTPSDDPDDPLNWSPRRKLLSTICVNTFTVIVPLSSATGLSVSDINAGTGYLFLLCGWGLLFWQPFALQYGKRPTYLISVLATLALTMWGPYASTNGQWIAKNVLAGFFAAPIEALPEISVTDVYFSHQRGTYMGVYAFFLAGSNYFAPVICGFINQYQGWRWVFYWPAIFLAFTFVFLFFFMEETNYERKTIGVVETSDAPSTESLQTGLDPEKASPAKLPEESSAPAGEAPIAYKKKTFVQKLALKDKSKPNLMFYRAKLGISFLTWPVIFYAGFSYGTYLIWFNVLNATASVLLSAPPYNFSSSLVGLSYLSCVLGVIGGAIFTGRYSDYLTLKLVRRNQGIMEPEQRLWPFAACVFIVPGSLILWGVGAAHGVHWFGLIAAMFLLAFANTCGITLSCNYMIDSYKEMSGEAMTTVIIVRNTMSFAIGYGITPWLDGMGTQNCFISAAFIGMAISAIFLVMTTFGKRFRAQSKHEYWALVRRSKEMGIAH